MTTSRRQFLKLSALTGLALILEIPASAENAVRNLSLEQTPFQPNQWLSIDQTGKVTIMAAKAEMGQGVRTSLPMIVAEELDVDWKQVTVQFPMPGTDFPRMRTSGSGSVTGSWSPLRVAGATAREMLIAAAAATWQVEPATCETSQGMVIHPPTGRKAAYGELVAAAAKLTPPPSPKVKNPTDFKLLGNRVKRVDGPDIVNGKAAYTADIRVPGMRFAAVKRSPVLGGKVARWDATKAKKIRGVRNVVQVPTGIAVIADDTWAAFRGVEALEIEWDLGANKDYSSELHWKRTEELSRQEGRVILTQGDRTKAVETAAHKLEEVYAYGFQAHAPVETLTCTVHVRKGECEIWTGTQCANQAQEGVAKQLGLEVGAVKMHVPLLGGAFGRRLQFDYVTEAVEVAKQSPDPVQVIWSRSDDMKHGYFHPASMHRMTGTVDASGKLTSFGHRLCASLLSVLGPPDFKDPNWHVGYGWGLYDSPYAFPAMHYDFVLVDSPVPSGPWRAVHYPPNVFARESFLDELAHAAKADPVEFRLEYLKGDVAPFQTIRPSLRRVIQLAAEKAGWGKPLPNGHALGIACNVYHERTTMAQIAEVSVGADGRPKLHRIVCAVECGQVVNPLGLEGQIESGIVWGLSAAMSGEITVKNGGIVESNYADFGVFRIKDMPRVEVYTVPSTAPPTGIGEQPAPPAAPAVFNAFFAAGGKRIRRLPMK
ncbi:MAG TPA: molybdopterin-dependent oxidoreductase [Acidobacteriota bacterium]|nr:molybdopterin-dependent oxidoreductase [Acidobacteriota bacterium]